MARPEWSPCLSSTCHEIYGDDVSIEGFDADHWNGSVCEGSDCTRIKVDGTVRSFGCRSPPYSDFYPIVQSKTESKHLEARRHQPNVFVTPRGCVVHVDVFPDSCCVGRVSQYYASKDSLAARADLWPLEAARCSSAGANPLKPAACMTSTSIGFVSGLNPPHFSSYVREVEK